MASFSVASPLRTSNNHNSALGAGMTTPLAAKAKKGAGQDRFIPPRGALGDLDAHFLASNLENDEASAAGVDTAAPTPSKRQYVKRLAEGLNVACPGEEKVNSGIILLT